MRGFCKGCSGCRVVGLRQTGRPPLTTRTTKTISDHSAVHFDHRGGLSEQITQFSGNR